MNGEHICTVCFQPMTDHHNDPGYFPPRCCHGCGCGEERPADDERSALGGKGVSMFSILIGTYGHTVWTHRARQHALPSALGQGGDVIARHTADGTLAEIRNALAAEALTDYVVFLDADDKLADGYVAALGAAFVRYMRSGVGTVMTESGPRPVKHGELLPWPVLVPALQYVRDGVCIGEAEIPAWDRSILDVNSCCIGTAYPRDFFLRLGGFGAEPVYEDWVLALRAVVAGAVLVPVPDAVYCATVSASGRNTGPEAGRVYEETRTKFRPLFPWDEISRYKLG